MKNAWIWIVVIVSIIVGGIIWYQSASPQAALPAVSDAPITQTPADSQAPSPSTVPGINPTGTGAAMSTTVTYTGSGFSPASVTIKQGGTVTFVNQGGDRMNVASDPHPQHSGYDGTSRNSHCAPGYTGEKPFDECAAGSSYSFTFTKVGSWGYHNHFNEEDGGVVNVVQ
ncbi:hypothetical protein HY968_04430 [Candidatus Kaiserbacteria bacterium]|nr:hypothetical protein [Candidatus Kaiserbacteria bacterium]